MTPTRLGSATPRRTAFIDSSFGIGDELLEVGVVGFLGITDDRKRRIVDDGVTGEEQKSVLAEAREGFLRTGNLASFRGVGVVERISIENGGNAGAFLIVGWRVEGEGEVESVGAFVFDEALFDGADFGRGVRNVSDRDGGGSEDGFAGGGVGDGSERARRRRSADRLGIGAR